MGFAAETYQEEEDRLVTKLTQNFRFQFLMETFGALQVHFQKEAGDVVLLVVACLILPPPPISREPLPRLSLGGLL